MVDENRGRGVAALAGALAMLLLLAAGALAVVLTGAYDVAASEEHYPLTRWAISTTMERSVRRQAGPVPAAEAVTPAQLATGAGEYQAMCQHCHGAPGAQREEWAEGMRPQPPLLTQAAREWQRNEIFWIVKHGIRMSGMPAFGATHDDATLRAIAAFVAELPGLSPERYAQLAAGAGTHGEARHPADSAPSAAAPGHHGAHGAAAHAHSHPPAAQAR